MSNQFRVLLIFVAFLTAISILRKIRKEKVQIQYSIFWILFSALLIVLAVFPSILIRLSRALGIGSPANLVFLTIIFLLLLKSFNLTVEISALEVKLKELTQRIALKEEEAETQGQEHSDSYKSTDI
ncbi:MAG: DUF2304 domain-containing protein [Eubacterium sp.]|nr:DUF2304 domain-containing protein [Eubacterium sp.]